MRISDWSSDVCSSDLGCARVRELLRLLAEDRAFRARLRRSEQRGPRPWRYRYRGRRRTPCGHLGWCLRDTPRPRRPNPGDRKSVVSGTSVSVRVDLGGRRDIKKNNYTSTQKTQTTKKANKS